VFATKIGPHGEKVIDATHVSLWGGTQFAVQILFQLLSPLTSDRYGVKVNLYIPTAAIVIVGVEKPFALESLRILTLPILRQAIVLEIVSKEWKVFLAAKIFAGIANAYLGPGLVCYVSEISMPKIRGAMTMPFAFMFAAGSLFGAVCLKAVQVSSLDAFPAGAVSLG
jgi:MFS family permease